jgi:hypothetical protein
MDRPAVVIIILVGMGVATAGYADMMPVPFVNATGSGSLCPLAPEYVQDAPYSNNTLRCLCINDLDSAPLTRLSDSNADVGQLYGTPPPEIFADGQSSFDLCLYALVGLGLYGSAPWVKRFSFPVASQWYHDAGLSPTGRSTAISQDGLCHVPLCFVQPVCTVPAPTLQYCLRTIVSLWRKSQFTPAALAGRGPPDDHRITELLS